MIAAIENSSGVSTFGGQPRQATTNYSVQNRDSAEPVSSQQMTDDLKASQLTHATVNSKHTNPHTEDQPDAVFSGNLKKTMKMEMEAIDDGHRSTFIQ